jgi:hypothetical protein
MSVVNASEVKGGRGPSWHPPHIAEHIMLSPPTYQLRISRKHPIHPEREAELNRARVATHRERQVDIMPNGKKKKHPRDCCTVLYDEDILNMLVGTGQILDHETEDAREVGKAISEMLAEAAQDWKTSGWADVLVQTAIEDLIQTLTPLAVYPCSSAARLGEVVVVSIVCQRARGAGKIISGWGQTRPRLGFSIINVHFFLV